MGSPATLRDLTIKTSRHRHEIFYFGDNCRKVVVIVRLELSPITKVPYRLKSEMAYTDALSLTHCGGLNPIKERISYFCDILLTHYHKQV